MKQIIIYLLKIIMIALLYIYAVIGACESLKYGVIYVWVGLITVYSFLIYWFIEVLKYIKVANNGKNE